MDVLRYYCFAPGASGTPISFAIAWTPARPRSTIGSNADLKRNKTRFDSLRAKWNDDDPPAAKIANRDAILDTGRSLINSYFVDYERELRRGSVTVDLGLGLTNLALTTASTLAGGEQTKTALSALATLTGGTQAAVDEAPSISRQPAPPSSPRCNRYSPESSPKSSATTILAAAQPTPAQNYSRYTIADVDEDLLELYEAGTITGSPSPPSATTPASPRRPKPKLKITCAKSPSTLHPPVHNNRISSHHFQGEFTMFDPTATNFSLANACCFALSELGKAALFRRRRHHPIRVDLPASPQNCLR